MLLRNVSAPFVAELATRVRSSSSLLSETNGALATLGREYFNINSTFEDGLSYSVGLAFSKDDHYTLFRSEDWLAWIIFTCVFFLLIAVDNMVMNRKMQVLTLWRAILYTLFWILCACGFCCWVYWWYGPSQAAMWISGYMLEWILSFDNLFVFHVIFTAYGTPDHLKHKPLYLGICGAIVFRLVFIFVGEYMMHAMMFMHLLFGSFLVYTGVTTAISDDDDDDDPSKQPLVQWLQKKVPFVSVYDAQGAFFVRVPVDDDGKALLPEIFHDAVAKKEEAQSYGTLDFNDSSFAAVEEAGAATRLASARSQRQQTQFRATMLLLVVLCLEISDMLFAVDSVSAIVAQVNDLFLAYTSAVFAMLGLRATFFIIDMLVRLFSLLRYGVAVVLGFIGIKLILGRWYHISPSLVCAVITTAIFGSMLASVLHEKLKINADARASPEPDI